MITIGTYVIIGVIIMSQQIFVLGRQEKIYMSVAIVKTKETRYKK